MATSFVRASRYDLAIEDARRSSGELYPRAKVEQILRALAWYLRMGGRQTAAVVAPQICAMAEPWQVNQALCSLTYEQLLNSFAELASQSGGEMEVPEWAIQALAHDLQFVLRDVPEHVKKRAEAIKVLVEHNAQRTVVCVSQK